MENNLIEFLNKNGIEILKENDKKYFHSSPEEHIENLIKFHRRVMCSDNYFDLHLKNNSGKEIINYKLWRNRAFLLKKELNITDNIFDELINRADEAIKQIEKSNYIKLMKRASLRKEIILGNSSIKNIFFKNNNIYIYDIDKIEFNMIENDLVKYICKEKKKKKKVSKGKVISLFLDGEGLDKDSFNYIYGMTNYPRECMKFISNSYINNLKDKELIKNKISDLIKIDYGYIREDINENKV